MRKRIVVPTRGPEDWKRLLAQPEKHWKTGFSAKTLAHAWEAANGFPPEVRAVLEGGATNGMFRDIELLLAVPEYEVFLEGGDRGSHNDVFVLARAPVGLVALVVEGKVDEDFGPTLEQWLKDSNSSLNAPVPNADAGSTATVRRISGKPTRWESLKSLLALQDDCPPSIRYQLVHRAASAVLEGQKFGARHAVMLIHSFSPNNNHLGDFQDFVRLYGQRADPGTLVLLGEVADTTLWSGWVCGEQRFRTIE